MMNFGPHIIKSRSNFAQKLIIENEIIGKIKRLVEPSSDFVHEPAIKKLFYLKQNLFREIITAEETYDEILKLQVQPNSNLLQKPIAAEETNDETLKLLVESNSNLLHEPIAPEKYNDETLKLLVEPNSNLLQELIAAEETNDETLKLLIQSNSNFLQEPIAAEKTNDETLKLLVESNSNLLQEPIAPEKYNDETLKLLVKTNSNLLQVPIAAEVANDETFKFLFEPNSNFSQEPIAAEETNYETLQFLFEPNSNFSQEPIAAEETNDETLKFLFEPNSNFLQDPIAAEETYDETLKLLVEPNSNFLQDPIAAVETYDETLKLLVEPNSNLLQEPIAAEETNDETLKLLVDSNSNLLQDPIAAEKTLKFLFEPNSNFSQKPIAAEKYNDETIKLLVEPNSNVLQESLSVKVKIKTANLEIEPDFIFLQEPLSAEINIESTNLQIGQNSYSLQYAINVKDNIDRLQLPVEPNLNFPQKTIFANGNKNLLTEPNSPIAIPKNYSFTAIDVRVYKTRWLILSLYVCYSALSSMHWIQYSIVSNIIVKYYGVSELSVDWTSMIFMVAYVILVYPVSVFIDRHGLRATALVGAFGTALGSWIKVASTSPDRFMVTFIGQCVLAVSQVFIHNVPSKLGAVWFAPEQESTACCIGVFGHQLGVAIAFLFTPMIVQNDDNSDNIGHDLTIIFYGLAIITTIVSASVAAFFKSKPYKPPSHAQAIHRLEPHTDNGFVPSMKRMVNYPGFLPLLLSFGINAGAYSAISTLLNQLVLNYYPDSEQDVGFIGLTLMASGMFGTVMFGYILDVTMKFREATIWVYFMSAIAMAAFNLALPSGSKHLVYVASAFLGLFMNGYPAVGSELASELTFPEPEGVVCGVLNAMTQVFGILLTLGVSWVQSVVGDFWAIAACTGLLAFGAWLMAFAIPRDAQMRRQNAHDSLASEAARELNGVFKNQTDIEEEEGNTIYVFS